MKSHFVSKASHQFRTPLSIIQSNIELIEMLTEGIESKNNSLLLKAQGRIQKEVERMTELMNDVLILGNIADHKKSLQFIPSDIVAECEKITSNLESIQPDNREVTIEVFGDPRPVYIDLSTIDHALENLFSNAFKYMSLLCCFNDCLNFPKGHPMSCNLGNDKWEAEEQQVQLLSDCISNEKDLKQVVIEDFDQKKLATDTTNVFLQ